MGVLMMVQRWLAKLIKRNVEWRAQLFCPHVYKVIYTQRESKLYDVYCPACHHMQENIKWWQWEQLQGIRKAREEYEEESAL